jgi:hypothetical protein
MQTDEIMEKVNNPQIFIPQREAELTASNFIFFTVAFAPGEMHKLERICGMTASKLSYHDECVITLGPESAVCTFSQSSALLWLVRVSQRPCIKHSSPGWQYWGGWALQGWGLVGGLQVVWGMSLKEIVEPQPLPLLLLRS